MCVAVTSQFSGFESPLLLMASELVFFNLFELEYFTEKKLC